jgi:DNA-binding MarR family transcriptional regulator
VKSLHNNPPRVRHARASVDALFDLTEVLGAMMRHGVTHHGLTRARAALLWALLHDGPMTQGALARALGVTPRNVTGLLDALEDSGQVTRAPHPGDRRAILVSLTDEGRRTTTGLRAGRNDMAAELFAGFTAEELATFRETLATVTERLRAMDPGRA